MYSPYDGVVKEIMVAEEDTAYLEKPLIIFEVEDDGETSAYMYMYMYIVLVHIIMYTEQYLTYSTTYIYMCLYIMYTKWVVSVTCVQACTV